MIGIRGIKQVSLAYCPPIMLATTTLSKSFVTMRRVPLHNIGGSRFLRSITGTPSLRISSWGGQPDGVSEFRNSVGYLVTSSSSQIVSTDMYDLRWPSTLSKTCRLMSLTQSFRGQSIALL